MVKTVSAAQANRDFSKLMKLVEDGEEVVVTSRGRPRIRLSVVVGTDEAAEQRKRAFDALTELMEQQPTLNLPKLIRDDFYD